MPNHNSETPARTRNSNPDPITGEPGAHPVGTGVGAAAGGATGAAIGSVGGPIGTAVGAVIGAVVGGLAGKGIAESIDPTAEDAYWREHHGQQKYADDTRPFDAFAPAYRTGYTGYREGQTFEESEADLQMEYEGGAQKADADAAQRTVRKTRTGVPSETQPGTMQNNMSTYPLRWDDAREAARAAYERVRRGEAAKRTAK